MLSTLWRKGKREGRRKDGGREEGRKRKGGREKGSKVGREAGGAEGGKDSGERAYGGKERDKWRYKEIQVHCSILITKKSPSFLAAILRAFGQGLQNFNT